LIGVTRTMIARARGAEERLRSMGQELQAVQRDLADARQSADHDQLTGLPNRRALEAALVKAVEGAKAADRALSLAFCDIDHFKRLNDTHGHALGDRVLRLVGDCLSDGAGPDAFVGRQGGEEFVMLFDGVPLEEAAARVDAVRADLAARDFKSRTNETPIGRITFSAGVAALRSDEEGDDLLHRADEALYRAKDAGRNRVEIDRD
jgi:diguanylate cyclase